MIDIKTAVIIKGNPKFIEGNSEADRFYDDLKRFLEGLGYSVSFDPGSPYTSPDVASVWVGHSRGVDRLRFAPHGTIVVSLGVEGGINHPQDQSLKKGDIPDSYHYILTEDMKNAIQKRIDEGISRY